MKMSPLLIARDRHQPLAAAVHPSQESPMNDERTVVADVPVESVWDLNDEELDRTAPARTCPGGTGFCFCHQVGA